MTDSLELEKIGVQTDEEIPYSIIENYIFEIQGLSANKKLFLLMIRKYAGAKQNPAFPSYKTLMKDIGSNSTATIMKCIDFFVWLKWLERVPRKKEGTKENISNWYILSLKNIRLILNHFEKNNYLFSDIEKYFESEYKKTDSRKEFLLKTCKYLV
jgi:hypothetical protein